MVDSTPFSTVPPSKSASNPASPEPRTSFTLFNDFCPDRFALVPTRYLQCFSNNNTHLLAGTLAAKFMLPAVTMGDILLSVIGATMVRAPGQYFLASAIPVLPSAMSFSASCALYASTGSGFFSSHPFILNIRLTAASLYGSQ